MTIRISAVICTLNRAHYLRKALESLVNQSLPREQYEIIVIDNGSTDNTKSVVCEEFKNFCNVEYFSEPALGLSRARNTGWRNAKGEYIAYLDDDAIASPQWLATILDVFETVKPKPGCVGGKVEPVWEATRPQWLSDSMVPYLTVVSWSDTPVTLADDQWLAGANMAFPRALLESGGGFLARLGRVGSKLSSMEEILWQRQLMQKGYSCYYHPQIAVGHHIPASRLTKNWFARRFYWQGVSDAVVVVQQDKPTALERFRKGFSVARSELLSWRNLTTLTMPSNSPDHFGLKCSIVAKFGYVVGLWGIAK